MLQKTKKRKVPAKTKKAVLRIAENNSQEEADSRKPGSQRLDSGVSLRSRGET
jgi:hypothetical protein